MNRIQRSYRICLRQINAAAFVIFFFYICISKPSLAPFNARTLETKADTSSFLQQTKAPVSNHLGVIAKELQCVPTSKLKIVSKPDDTWVLQSYTQNGTKKDKGGDEYYVTYKDNNNDSIVNSAIAHIKDNKDGTYALYFVKSRNQKIAEMKMAGNGTVTVNLIHTCGIGSLEPPLKNNWTVGMKNGATNAIFKSFNHSMPVMNEPYWPKSYGHEFSHYDRIFAVGDSLMRGIFFNRRPNIEYICVGASLNSESLSFFTPILSEKTISLFTRSVSRGRHLAELKYGNLVKNKKMAVILGSCVWDLLATQTLSTDSPRYSFVMSEHLNATKTLIKIVRKQFPEFDVYWKGCTSMHHQAVDCNGFTEKNCASRVLYMSSRRAKKLDVAQKSIMKEFNIPVWDLFDMSFEMIELLSDGRHFKTEWYEYVLNYFFPESKKE